MGEDMMKDREVEKIILDMKKDLVNFKDLSILDRNEETLKDIATRSANIAKEGVETTAGAIRNGLTEDTMFCKYCGQSIDEDSKYCQYCGKEQ